jgi:hypothetical protein
MANKIYNTTNTTLGNHVKEVIFETELPPAEGYDKSVRELLDLAYEIETAKRPGYTLDSPDVLANFKKAAEMTGCTPMQAWGAYFYKHVAAILSYAKDPNIEQAEPLDGRFADAINYLKLGFHMLQEEKLEQEINNQQKLPF